MSSRWELASRVNPAMTVSLVGFDADDTLWHSESHFAVTEEKFRSLVEPWVPADTVDEALLNQERSNLELFGYGVKGFTLSMVETAVELTDGAIPASSIREIIEWGKELMTHPVELLDKAKETIEFLSDSYRLVLITKGDLFHQESKVAESGLADYFERVEILSEKSPMSYAQVLNRLGADPERFIMVGNSLRSDVLPVVRLGAKAVHVPYGITWAHEHVEIDEHEVVWEQIEHLGELPPLLDRVANHTSNGQATRSNTTGGIST